MKKKRRKQAKRVVKWKEVYSFRIDMTHIEAARNLDIDIPELFRRSLQIAILQREKETR